MDWNFTDDRPIWQQIVEQLTLRILKGEYPPGERLPGVRELAAQAGVNPNTMQRAMAQLEGWASPRRPWRPIRGCPPHRSRRRRRFSPTPLSRARPTRSPA